MTSRPAGDALSQSTETAYSFDPNLEGVRVEADGGNAAIGSILGSRETFTGCLTGRRLDVGSPAWCWLEIGELTERPEGFEGDLVWCESSYIYRLDGKSLEE